MSRCSHRGQQAFDLVETLEFAAIHPMAVKLNKQAGKVVIKVTHKSRTSFKTLDIIFKLPSRALNSTSWDGDTAPHALMFCTASTVSEKNASARSHREGQSHVQAVFSGTRTCEYHTSISSPRSGAGE
jgi:hypothetical protein